MLYKVINIGQTIKELVEQKEIPMQRICNFLGKDEEYVNSIYNSTSVDSEILLRWSKLLEYDLFRIYSTHLILYAPPSSTKKSTKPKASTPEFRKNIYTQEIKDFIIKRIKNNEMTQAQVIQEYSIPKTTLHRWLQKVKEV